MRKLGLSLCVLASACTTSANGLWGQGDGGLAFFDIDGGRFFHTRELELREIALLLSVDCRDLIWQGERLVYTGRSPEFMWPVREGVGPNAVQVELRDPYIEEGYRIRHRDAGLVGPLRLSFDAGVTFDVPGQASFSWLATYLDDTGVVATEGGSARYEPDDSSCR